jgi:hypothetical protein
MKQGRDTPMRIRYLLSGSHVWVAVTYERAPIINHL